MTTHHAPFGIWAPRASRVRLAVAGDVLDMVRGDDDWWSLADPSHAAVTAGGEVDYGYLVDDDWDYGRIIDPNGPVPDVVDGGEGTDELRVAPAPADQRQADWDRAGCCHRQADLRQARQSGNAGEVDDPVNRGADLRQPGIAADGQDGRCRKA